MGNTDEMLVQANSLEKFASQYSAPPGLWKLWQINAANPFKGRRHGGEATPLFLVYVYRGGSRLCQPPT